MYDMHPCSGVVKLALCFVQGAVTTIVAGQPTIDFTACFAMFYGTHCLQDGLATSLETRSDISGSPPFWRFIFPPFVMLRREWIDEVICMYLQLMEHGVCRRSDPVAGRHVGDVEEQHFRSHRLFQLWSVPFICPHSFYEARLKKCLLG